MAMERLLSLKKELQHNFEILKQEHEDLKSANDEYSLEIKQLLNKIGERDTEINNMKAVKADYETLYHKYQNLERIHSLLRENAEKFQEENQDLHEEVFKLQEQVTKLEHEIEIAAKHSELSDMVPRESYEELLKEINDLKDRRNSNQVHLDEINIDDNAKSVIENLKREINELKYKLSQKDSDSFDSKAIRPERVMQLYNKYVNFELPIDYVGEIPSAGDNIVFYKLESVFKTINSFKKDIDLLEHKLSERNLNANHLQTQIDDLTTENDFLTTDIQQLERELNEMRKNNDFLISEIAALKNTSKLEPIIETHEDNLAKLETELADSNKMNKNFESEIKRIQKELSEVSSEKIKLQDSLSDLKDKYTSMLEEMDLYKNQTKAVEELEHSVAIKQSEKLKKTANEIDELKKKLNAASAKNEQLSIDIHILENDKVLLTKQVDDLKHALDEKSSAHKELESMKLALDHKLQDFESRLDEVFKDKKDIESEKLNLQEKVTILEQELTSTVSMSDTDKINTGQTEKIDQLVTENKTLSEIIEKQKEQIVGLKTKASQLVEENNAKKLSDIIEKQKEEIVGLKKKESQLVDENNAKKFSEIIEKQKEEIVGLKTKESQLVEENNALKNNTELETENKSLQETIEDLKAKVIQQEILTSEVSNLKEENSKLVEKKLQLETELSSTDGKIVHLEEEFDKLISDLNEKDSLIDALNSTVDRNNVTLTNLSKNIADLENSISIKDEEITRLTHSLEAINQKLNDTNYKSNASHEELKSLLTEKEDMSKQIFSLNDEINSKNTQLSKLTNRLGELEELSKAQIHTLDIKDKEIKELTQTIVEITDKIKTADMTHHNDEYAKVLQEKTAIESEVTQLKENLTLKEKAINELKVKSEQIEKTAMEYKTIIDNATAEKTELINLINLKHNESLQYHNEIQRLNHVILEQSNEFKRIIEEKEKILQNSGQNCTSCDRLRLTLKEKDELIIALNHTTSDYDRMRGELANASEAMIQLTEKCDNLDSNLAVQLDVVKKLTAENAQLSEQEQNAARELERLRHHLVETEENYTQELMTSEQKLTECQTRLHQIEERAKQTSTVYTSNSIRANQEVETLRNQIKLLEKQREEVQARLGEAEDARGRSEAALTNLQVVLEQFQLDKERDIHTATEKIRNKMEEMKRENARLQGEISKLNAKLEESLAGLQAASRLGDQVETKAAQINDLKEQVRTLQTSVAASEERYYNAISNQQDKVDKNLVKNLVINYVMTAANNSTNKTQVLRVLSTVLDFNQQECERLGLARAAAGEGLAAEFVRFLQNESRPRAALPSMMGLTSTSTRSTTPSSRKNSTIGPPPTTNMPTTGHSRNPSTGSNNLLFQNIDAVETSSQLSRDSDREPKVVSPSLDTGVNQTRNTEGAILKYVLKDM